MELHTGDDMLDTAFRIAVEDVRSNVVAYRNGLLDESWQLEATGSGPGVVSRC